MSVTEFSIDRAKWGKHRLLNDNGSMCCLGFLTIACGIDPIEMGNSPYPKLHWTSFPKSLLYTEAMDNACRLNDEMEHEEVPALTGKAKEDALISLFAEHNITLTFYGEYATKS